VDANNEATNNEAVQESEPREPVVEAAKPAAEAAKPVAEAAKPVAEAAKPAAEAAKPVAEAAKPAAEAAKPVAEAAKPVAEAAKPAADSAERLQQAEQPVDGKPEGGKPSSSERRVQGSAASRGSGSGRKRVLVGRVVSDRMQKTIVVQIERRKLHPLYKKYITRTKKVKAHDEGNECGIGDLVRVIESRPISKDKRWRLVEILERAK